MRNIRQAATGPVIIAVGPEASDAADLLRRSTPTVASTIPDEHERPAWLYRATNHHQLSDLGGVADLVSHLYHYRTCLWD